MPKHVDGPSIVEAASALMLIPQNASRLVRLHRLAALGMALNDQEASSLSPSAIRSLLKREDFGHDSVASQEDPYSEVLVQSISFPGGPYLVSSGTGEGTVADLENLIDAIFRERWMPADVIGPTRQLIRALLTVSDMVIMGAGLSRGTVPGRLPGTPIDVPSAENLKVLTEAVFLSNEALNAQGEWLLQVVDTFALDAGELLEPCAHETMDDRIYITPFLRLRDGYLVVLPLDLLITIRFHLLRFAGQAGLLEELGKRWRQSAFRRVMRLLPSVSAPTLLEETDRLSRYLIAIDDNHDLHLILATDPLIDWDIEDVWGRYDTSEVLDRICDLVAPDARVSYSSAEGLLHLVIVDSPGRSAFWGVPNVDGMDPMLIARSDDLEVIFHQESDGLLGLMLFAQAIEQRQGSAISAAVLDEYSAYVDLKKSFYFSDDAPPTFTVFQPGDGFFPRQKHIVETDRHGVIPPGPNAPMLQAQRVYAKDAPEIFHTVPGSSYFGFVLELDDNVIFIAADVIEPELADLKATLLECAAYWVREISLTYPIPDQHGPVDLVVKLEDPTAWTRAFAATSQSASATTVVRDGQCIIIELGDTFLALLQETTNSAERELVAVLLVELFGVPVDDLSSRLDSVAPLGAKRMLNVFSQDTTPDMMAAQLPRALSGHDQVAAQVLDELGEWLRSPTGGQFTNGALKGEDRVRVLNDAVGHLFERLETQVALFESAGLMDFLVAQNESLLHVAKVDAIMLRSRLACFGEQSDTVSDLVQQRTKSASSQRANRFLIEYAAAQPPAGHRSVTRLDYYLLLELAREIVERATASDFLYYKLADFEISILDSGRLGQSRDEPVVAAIDRYAANSGTRSIRKALSDAEVTNDDDFDVSAFIDSSSEAMRAEFGFTLSELREVCGGLLEMAAADAVTRIARAGAVRQIAADRGVSEDLVSAVLSGITLTARSSFLEIGQDALPWRFNRDMAYVRRPLVLQGDELVFGFRSLYGLGPYWLENMLSGRLQGRAKTVQMQQCISQARGAINQGFARAVSVRLQQLGITTRLSVNKIAGRRIADESGKDLGDIDVLGVHAASRTLIAIEAKDFEIARTPSELSSELEKLFTGKKGKKSTVELHSRRLDWLRHNVHAVVQDLVGDPNPQSWTVVGAIVTSDPLVTPLSVSSTLPVIPCEDLALSSLVFTKQSGVPAGGRNRISRKRRKNGRR